MITRKENAQSTYLSQPSSIMACHLIYFKVTTLSAFFPSLILCTIRNTENWFSFIMMNKQPFCAHAPESQGA